MTTKYKTKPIIDPYQGCRPVIADHLVEGKAILCNVWGGMGSGKVTDYVVGYVSGQQFCYRTKDNGYQNAEPVEVETKYKIMDAGKAVAKIVAVGGSFDSKGCKQLVDNLLQST